MCQTITGVRQRLEAERERLRRDIRRLNGEHHAAASYSNHPADTATDVSEDATNSALAQIQLRHLTMVEEALRRLKAGTCGVCEDCRTHEVLPLFSLSFPRVDNVAEMSILTERLFHSWFKLCPSSFKQARVAVE